jgi:MFS family permease
MMFINYGIKNISYLLAIIQLSKIIFDIPTGIIADLYSRRNLLLFGQITKIIVFSVWLLFPVKKSFILGSILWGFSMSCIYYHTEAYLFDSLKKINKQNSFSSTIGKYYAIQNISITIATFMSGYIFTKYSYKGVLLASIATIIFSIFIILKLPNYKVSTLKKGDHFATKNPLKFSKLLHSIITNAGIARLMFFSATLDAIFILFIDLNTTIMSVMKFHPTSISLVVGIAGFIRIFSNYFSGYSVKHMSFKRMNSYLLIMAIFILIFTGAKSIFLTGSIVTYLCIYPFLDNSVKTKIQNKIDSSTRATVMSFASIITSIIAIILNLINGAIASKIGYRASTMALAIIIIIGLTLLRNITALYRITNKIIAFLVKLKNFFD